MKEALRGLVNFVKITRDSFPERPFNHLLVKIENISTKNKIESQ